MASFPSKVLVPTAINDRSQFDLSGDNITTSDFFRLKASKIIEVLPGDDFNISSESLIRMFPLQKPMFGRCNHYMRWFWVPMRSIMLGWNEFYGDTPFTRPDNGNVIKISNVPWFRNSDIVEWYLDSLGDNPLAGYFAKGAGTAVPDAVIYDGDRVSYPILFTKEGRSLLDLLQNLGYNINFTTVDRRQLSALPLLAYFRVIADFYISPQYLNGVMPLFRFWTGNILDDSQQIADIVYNFVHGYSNYDNDYFVSAWDNPNYPNDDHVNAIEISDPSLENVEVDFYGDSSPYVVMTGDSNTTYFTQYILNSLRAVTNYCVRNNIAGYRFWDRLKAEYNVNMDYKQRGTSLYIDTFKTPLQISEVLSTADTQGATLADYAGKGLGYSAGNSFHFDPQDEAGYLVAVSSIVPTIGYYQGTVKENTHLNRLDFFTPEFDQLGVQPISVGELFTSQFFGQSVVDAEQIRMEPDFNPDRVFGYTPRYSEYKRGTSTLTGDFRLNSRSSSGSINAFHLMRIVANEFDSDFDQNSEMLHHNVNFVQGENDQYDRIFANTNPDYDHFYCIHHHEIHCTRNMKSLQDSIFDDEELRHDRKTEVDYNGSQFN